jgi:hypothetical protein
MNNYDVVEIDGFGYVLVCEDVIWAVFNQGNVEPFKEPIYYGPSRRSSRDLPFVCGVSMAAALADGRLVTTPRQSSPLDREPGVPKRGLALRTVDEGITDDIRFPLDP